MYTTIQMFSSVIRIHQQVSPKFKKSMFQAEAQTI